MFNLLEEPKLPSTLNELNYNKIEVHRAEVRNGKIIIVIEPSLLSSQTFAVNPFYDEGDKKNQLQEAHFSVSLTERNREITKCTVNFGNSLGHFTKGHTQIHDRMENLFFTKIEKAVHEILTTDVKYLEDDSRMNKLLTLLDSDREREHVSSLIDDRLSEVKSKRVIVAKEALKEAMAEYEAALDA